MPHRTVGMSLAALFALVPASQAVAQGEPQPPVTNESANAPTGTPSPTYASPVMQPAQAGVFSPGRSIPTADLGGAQSDHDAVVGHWGLEAVALTSPLGGFVTAPGTLGSIFAAGVRQWMNRNMAFNVDLAFLLGGGSSEMGGTTLTKDTYFAIGPAGGVTFLLGNWKHLAVGASPQLAFIYFTPGGDGDPSTVVFSLRALMEGELHLGFIGFPALSLSINTGLAFNLRSVEDVTTDWQISMLGPTGFWGAITNFAIRFYM